MTGPAIAMLVVAGVTVWGGLTASVIHLVRHTRKNDD